MIPPKKYLRINLSRVLKEMKDQGYDTEEAEKEFAALPESYDSLLEFAEGLPRLPYRKDWNYVEPESWEEVLGEFDPAGAAPPEGAGYTPALAAKIESAFLGSVLGCILGKPLEVNPSFDELKKAGEAAGEWPLSDFVSGKFLAALGRRHPSWAGTVRENIGYVAADDDINYTILGMLNLEDYGPALDLDGIKSNWIKHISLNYVFGPEQTIASWTAVNRLVERDNEAKELLGVPPHPGDDYYLRWSSILNPGNELCGAAIRADAYGYAFPGQPGLAAKYAFTDASFTHRKTGVYSAMYIAAAISLEFGAEDPLKAMEDALCFVPRRSRFYANTKAALEYVKASSGFEEAYRRIHQRFAGYSHCRLYQEIGTLINTMAFARGIWDGVCKQVSQGNDTDSFGCTAGSLLGAYFGPASLPEKQLALFNDDIRTGLASFFERSLKALAKRMGELPLKVGGKKSTTPPQAVGVCCSRKVVALGV
jgi:ADP-ribosylglycohydrolase